MDFIFAALVVHGNGDLHLVPLKSTEWEDADKETDDLLASDGNNYQDCIWILDARDMMNLAEFIGQEKVLFRHELGLDYIPESWLQ